MRISRAVMTQSTSLTGNFVDEGAFEEDRQYRSVNSCREASSFLSKHGMMERCQIWAGEMLRVRQRIVFNNVPVRACGDFMRERCGRM